MIDGELFDHDRLQSASVPLLFPGRYGTSSSVRYAKIWLLFDISASVDVCRVPGRPAAVASFCDGELKMRHLNYRRPLSAVVLLACVSATPYLHAQENQDEDFDTYKLRVDANWYYSNPTGTLHGANDSDSIDVNKDLHFQATPLFQESWIGSSRGRITFTWPPFRCMPRARQY
jgi:hypothetical protein